MNTDKIEQKTSIDAPIEKVWKVLTTSDGLKSWYAFGGAEIDLRPGGKITFRWDEHGSYYGIVESVEVGRHFSFRFAPFTENAIPTKGSSTLVDIMLMSNGTSTQVQLIESGYLALEMPENEKSENYAASKSAWADALSLLKAASESS